MEQPSTEPPRRARRLLPIIGWWERSDAGSRRADVVAGLTVAAMLVPQAMAYAALAGMPPVTGLYASTVPLVAYALLGTSGQLAFGPVAIMSLLTASTLAPVADGDPGRYVALAGLLALLVGGIQLLLGIIRAGKLTGLLSHPVVSGFTSAAAIVIATSQLDKLFGISIGPVDGWLERVTAIATSLGATSTATLAVGLVAMGVLVAGRRLAARIPTPLLVVVLATAAVPVFGLEAAGVAVLGEVPGGVPLPQLPLSVLDATTALLPGAAIIALLGYLEGLSVARAIAVRTRDRVDPDQELVASAAANLAAGVFQGFPVAGGFSRTAVNHDAGARSPLASIVTAAGVLLALVLVAPLLATLPEVVLAAVVLVAVTGLVDVRGAVHAWQVERTDGLALTITFVATLTVGIEVGIGVGIAASLLLSLWRTGIPGMTLVPRTRDLVLHVTGPLLPASGARLLDEVEGVLCDPELRADALILELSGVPSVDVSGLESLAAIDAACAAAEIELRLVGVREAVATVLRRDRHLDTRLRGRVHLMTPEMYEPMLALTNQSATSVTTPADVPATPGEASAARTEPTPTMKR